MYRDPERENSVFKEMHDVVHLDELWYYLTRIVVDHYYLAPHEPDPDRRTRHKSHIPKCMFLSAVARLRFDNGRNQWFDGKLGLWPIAHEVPAQRDSNNRRRGTLEWKDLTMDKARCTLFLLEQVIPAIMEQWPPPNRTIELQQDNAKPHLSPEEFGEVYEENREHLQKVFGGGFVWEISLFNQPANSPDLNMNDLAFFVSSKAEYWKDPAQTIGGMIRKMAEIFANYPGEKVSSGFMTLQVVMNQIIEHDGGNEFRLGHIGKERCKRLGELPLRLDVHEEAAYWDVVNEDGDDENSEVENEQNDGYCTL
jgi:hypothetical protein